MDTETMPWFAPIWRATLWAGSRWTNARSHAASRAPTTARQKAVACFRPAVRRSDPMAPEEQLRVDALQYHESPVPGKISIAPTKALANQRDLSLAYSPGVAYACTAIQHDPQLAARYTARANLVAVVTNGTAVLGLGNIGALA